MYAQLSILELSGEYLNVCSVQLPTAQYIRFIPLSSFLLAAVMTAIPYFLPAGLLLNPL